MAYLIYAAAESAIFRIILRKFEVADQSDRRFSFLSPCRETMKSVPAISYVIIVAMCLSFAWVVFLMVRYEWNKLFVSWKMLVVYGLLGFGLVFDAALYAWLFVASRRSKD